MDSAIFKREIDSGMGQFATGLVALIVALIAFAAAILQVMQQYYASAVGYSQCNEKVMGGWATTKRRRFAWSELRYEVRFEAPVIFVSPPNNKNGPIPNEKIYFLDGSKQSLAETWTTAEMDLRKEYSELTEKERVHTADNERASWFIMLYALQRMEAKSSEWQQKQYGPPGELTKKYGLPKLPPSLKEHHTLTAALQRKRKSWDTMPPSIIRPYATTTMCHLIEMLAALGVYWKVFDRRKDRYWAEGNGFLVLGSRVDPLGLMFSFQVYGQCNFESNRVIPVDYVKELCFGYVTTIYRSSFDARRLQLPGDMPEDLSWFLTTTRRDVAESLRLIGCNNNTVNYYLEDGHRTSHLFPVSFELLGMFAKNFHINNSSFTYIPNPTPDRWDKRAVSMSKVLSAFRTQIDTPLAGGHRNPTILRLLKHHADEILQHYAESDGAERLLCLRVLQLALCDADEILTGVLQDGQTSGDSTPVNKKEPETTIDQHQRARKEIVQDVARSHFQEVLKELNERDDKGSENQSLHVPDRVSPRHSRNVDATRPRFGDMDDVPADERQQMLMEVYFEVVRRRVVPVASMSAERRASLVGGRSSSLHSRRVSDAGQTNSRPASVHASPLVQVITSTHSSDSADEADNVEKRGRRQHVQEKHGKPETTSEPNTPLAMLPVSHDDIWCTLVFRMICWLMMHDFHKLDRQVPKSELLGSRMPVYIS